MATPLTRYRSAATSAWCSRSRTRSRCRSRTTWPSASSDSGSPRRARWTTWSSESLRQAALWDEVKDKLDTPGTSLSGGQQQRLCIARVLAVHPQIILMDEPCSALDPIATLRIEELMQELARNYTIVIVTHNMQQAARVSHWTAFMLAGEERVGEMIEFGPTNDIFTNPHDKRTEDYITGRFG